MSMKNTTRRIFSAVTAGVMLSVSAGAPVPFAHPVSFAEEAQQGDTLSAVAWLYLNAGKLDEAAYAMAYEQLGVTGQELLEQLRTGLLVLCRAADGTYYTKLAEEMTEADTPAVPDAVDEQPMEPTVEEPKAEEPEQPDLPDENLEPDVGMEEPEVEEPEVEEPVVEEPEVEEPEVEEPVVEEPVVEEPEVEEPVVEEPVVEEPAVEEPVVTEAPAVEEPAQEEPVVTEAPAVEEPAQEEPVVEEPVVEEPEVEEPIVEEPVEEETQQPAAPTPAPMMVRRLRGARSSAADAAPTPTPMVVSYAAQNDAEANDAPAEATPTAEGGSTTEAPSNEKRALVESEVKFAVGSFTYTGEDQSAAIWDSVNLETTDGTALKDAVTYEFLDSAKNPVGADGVKNAGKYYVRVTATDTSNYTGSLDFEVTVAKRSLKMDEKKITFGVGNFIYTGEDQSAAIWGSVNLENTATNDTALKDAVTYAFQTEDGKVINAGTYTLCVTAADTSNYTGSLDFEVTVAKRSLEMDEKKITFEVGGFTYTGKDQSAAIWDSVNLENTATNDTALKDAVTYAFLDSAKNPVGADGVKDAGQYYVRVTATDASNYTGSLDFEFTVAPYELTVTAHAYVLKGQDVHYLRSTQDVGEDGSRLTITNYMGDSTVDLYVDLSYEGALPEKTTPVKLEAQISGSVEAPELQNLKDLGPNYHVTCQLATIEVRDYKPDVQFAAEGNDGWPVQVAENAGTWFKGNEITFSATETGENVIAGGSLHLCYVETADEPAGGFEQECVYTAEEGKRNNTEKQTFYFYVTQGAPDHPDYGAVTKALPFDVYYDSANITNVSNQVTITPRDNTVTLTNDGGEAAYVYVTYDSGDMQQTQPDPLTQPGKSIPMNGGSGEYKLNLNAQGDETQRTNVYQDEKTGTQESQVNYLPTGAKVLVYAYDEAGNEAKTIELTVTAKEVAGLTASSTQYTLTKYTLANKDEKVSVISKDTPAYTLSGEPNEIVEIKYADKTFYIRLDAEGKATVDMVNFVGVQPKDDNEKQVHEIQQVTFSYPEAYPTAADKKPEIQVKQGEATVTCNFIYDTYAFPISATLETNNRSRTLSVTLPEDASCVKVYRVQDDREIGSLESPLTGNQPYDVDLIWKGNELLHSGNETLYIKYWDLAGNVSSAALVNLTQARVATPITITEMEPVANENGYYGGQFNLLRVTGTAHPCELIHVTIPGVLDATDTVSGDPNTYAAETNAAGVWTIYINLKMLPQNEKLQMTAHYDDVVGEGDAREFTSDRVCYPSMLLTPIDENTKVISGIAEPGSVVTLLYNGERIKANKVYAHGVFTLTMPMTFAGDTVTLQTVDLGGNVDKQTFEVGDEQTDVTLKGYMLGKLSTTMDKKDADPDWLMAGRYSQAELQQGVTVSLVAANAFKFGEIHIKMDEQGMVTYDYDLDEGVTVDSSYFTVAEKQDVDAMLAHELPGYDRGVAFDPAVKGKNMWISAEFVVTMPADKLESTFLTDKESELYKEYFARMRNSSMLKKAEK